MTERNDRPAERRSAEGVRIIGPEEAQAALEAGQAAGRLTEEELRYGDVPPAPSGPRPAHRFPLPDSVPAEAVPLPPVAPLARPPVVRAPRASEAAGSLRAGSRPGAVPDEHARFAGETDPGVRGASESAVAAKRAVGSSELPEVSHPESRKSRGTGTAPGTRGPDEIDLDAPDPLSDLGRLPSSARSRSGEQRPRGRAAPPPPLPDEDLDGPDRDQGASWVVSAPGGDTPAAAFVEADPTGRVPVFDPGSAGPTGPEPTGPEPTGPEPAAPVDAGGVVASPGGPFADEAPPPAPPGSGLRWATRPEEAQSVESFGETWAQVGSWAATDDPGPVTAEAPAATGDDPWYRLPGPDDPTAIHPAVTAEPAEPDAGDRSPVRGERSSDPGGWSSPPGPGGIAVWGGGDLPHWTEPPTGEVPISLAGLGSGDPGSGTGGGARWRRGQLDWDDGPVVEDLASDELPLGALNQDRSEESDLFSFDEDFERLEAERATLHAAVPPDDLAPDDLAPDDPGPDDPGPDDPRSFDDPSGDYEELVGVGVGASGRRAGPGGRAAPPFAAGRGVAVRQSGTRRRPPGAASDSEASAPRPDLSGRLGIGVGLAVVTIAAYFVGVDALLGLVALGLLGAAAEAFTMLRDSGGFRPATLVGMLATLGLVLGAWWKGEGALPLVLAVATVATMLWYLLGVSDARPLANVMATLSVVVWVGLLGSFAALLLRAPHGRGLLFAAFVTVVMADVVAYFGGRSLGKHKLAPQVSPGKTVEGFLAGGVAALVVGAVVGHVIPGWGGIGHGLALGLVVAIFAPIGDLFESLIKRDLDIKDSGRLLAGHGGLLDRFDSVILVLPAVYYLAVAMHLA